MQVFDVSDMEMWRPAGMAVVVLLDGEVVKFPCRVEIDIADGLPPEGDGRVTHLMQTAEGFFVINNALDPATGLPVEGRRLECQRETRSGLVKVMFGPNPPKDAADADQPTTVRG